jgi:hypothetical protein
MKSNVHSFIIYLSFLLRMRNILAEFVEKIKTQTLCSVNFFRKTCPLWDHVEKHGRATQAVDDNVAHPHCMLDKQSYRRTLRMCNTYCFYGNNGYRYEPKRYVILHCLSCLSFMTVLMRRICLTPEVYSLLWRWLRNRRWQQQYLHFTRLKPFLLPKSTFKILSSSPCTQIAWISVSHLTREAKFHTHKQHEI